MSTYVSPIYLLHGTTGEPVPGELRDVIGETELEHWEDHWIPYLHEKLRDMKGRGVPREEWPQHRHWDWRSKAADVEMMLAQRGFAVRCEGMTQGLLVVDLVQDCRLESQRGKPLVYLEYVEAAPWNQPRLQNPPKYRGVGSVLVAAAVSLSLEEGFAGRIGLHSLRQADAFYSGHCGMTELGRDAEKQNLMYFEMTPEQAQAFLHKGD